MTTQQTAAPDTLGLDHPWLAEPPKRSRLRLLLVVLLAAAVVFYAGVEVQRRYGTAGGTGTAAGPAAGGFTPPDGAAFPGGRQLAGGGQPGTGNDTPGTDDSGTGSQGGSAGDSVIGTVVSLKGDKLVVEDFGGKKHTITVSSDVSVVIETPGKTSDLQAGTTVQVTDSTITVR